MSHAVLDSDTGRALYEYLERYYCMKYNIVST
jgi:hypothetical protein